MCDGAFYAGQDAAVCGGGSAALQDALYLADICRHVTVIHRRTEFRADPVLVEEARGRANITLLTGAVVTALEGTDRLTGLTLENTLTGEVSHLEAAALFEAVGQLPETGLAASPAAPGRRGLHPLRGGLPHRRLPVSSPPGTAGPRPSGS